MKYLLNIILSFIVYSSDFIFANPDIENFKMSKIELNNYFDSELQRILIVPQANTYKGEKVLRGTGNGVIVGDDISKFETELSSIIEVVEPMLNSEFYQIYIFYNNKRFDETKQIIMCEVNGDKVNLIVNHDDKIVHLRLSDKVSKLITTNIIKKTFSFPPIE